MSDADRIAALEAEVAALKAALAAQDSVRSATVAAQHRTRNLIASVRSVATRTAEGAHDIGSFIAHFDGPLGALARFQIKLNRSTDLTVDFEELVRDEFLAHGLEHSPRITLNGPTVRLGPRTGEAIALAVHELTVNAMKFGALSHETGTLELRWTEENGKLTIDWREQAGIPLARSSHEGFGRQLIERGLPFQLGATTSLLFLPEGLQGHITTLLGEAA